MKCKKMEKAELKEGGEEKADVCDPNALAMAVKAGKDEEKNSGKKCRRAEQLRQQRDDAEGRDPGAVVPAGFNLLYNKPDGPEEMGKVHKAEGRYEKNAKDGGFAFFHGDPSFGSMIARGWGKCNTTGETGGE